MRLGYVMRQQVVAAIHAKVLRLNSASVAYASTGAQRRWGRGQGGKAPCSWRWRRQPLRRHSAAASLPGP
jgi:hypothetical protein